jgi:hypothetical protein
VNFNRALTTTKALAEALGTNLVEIISIVND